MDTFPVYDYAGESPAGLQEQNIDGSSGLWKTVNQPPTQDTAEITFWGDLTTALGKGIAYPFQATGSTVSTVVEKAKSTVRNTYLYLIGGIAIIGILAIVILGVGARFMARVEGR